jgi:hypothetical protein
MPIDFPNDIGSVAERLARLEDPAFARALARDYPLHFPGAAPAPARMARVRRACLAVLALAAAGSLVGSSFFLPLLAQRAVEQPKVTVRIERDSAAR